MMFADVFACWGFGVVYTMPALGYEYMSYICIYVCYIVRNEIYTFLLLVPSRDKSYVVSCIVERTLVKDAQWYCIAYTTDALGAKQQESPPHKEERERKRVSE